MKTFFLNCRVLATVVLVAFGTGGFVATVFVSAASAAAADPLAERMASPTVRSDARLNDVCFADARHGWAVGDHGTIWHTDNGGQLWRLQTSGVICSLKSVCFVSHRQNPS